MVGFGSEKSKFGSLRSIFGPEKSRFGSLQWNLGQKVQIWILAINFRVRNVQIWIFAMDLGSL